MNTRMKIAVGVLAGLVAGVMLVGTAFAVSRMMVAAYTGGYQMMQGYDGRGTNARVSIADMNRFMDRYRISDGSVDYNRMYADVTSGEVTPPCVTGSADARSPRTMMGRYGSDTGYWMMGSPY